MNWILYSLPTLAIGAVVRAFYQRVKKWCMFIEGLYIPHDQTPAAHTNAKQIRAERFARQHASGSDMF